MFLAVWVYLDRRSSIASLLVVEIAIRTVVVIAVGRNQQANVVS